jgi:hypothetical protein
MRLDAPQQRCERHAARPDLIDERRQGERHAFAGNNDPAWFLRKVLWPRKPRWIVIVRAHDGNGPGRCACLGLRAPARCLTVSRGTFEADYRGASLKLGVVRRHGAGQSPGAASALHMTASVRAAAQQPHYCHKGAGLKPLFGGTDLEALDESPILKDTTRSCFVSPTN